jgi:DNA recombination protein RmuC
MTETQILLVIGLLGAGVLLLAVFALLRQKQEQVRAAQNQLSQQTLEAQLAAMANAQSELTGRLSQMVEAQAGAQIRQTKSLEDRLDKVSSHLNQSLGDTATKTAKSLGELNTRLSTIDQAQKNITELSGKVLGLQDILSNKQARGAFGEIQMGDIVRNALPPSAYDMQVTLPNKKIVDCLIKLPNPPGSIGIDSKFPLESFYALRAAETDEEKKLAVRAFRQAFSKHINDISEKYIVPGTTAESALLFLPSEAIFAELHANFVEILEESYKARVWIVSPTTLMATLNTVRAVLKDAQMREQAGLIQIEVGKMMGDVHRLRKRVGNLESHFQLAEKDIREITTSSDKVLRSGERIEDVQFEGAEEGAPSTAALSPVEPPHLTDVSKGTLK